MKQLHSGDTVRWGAATRTPRPPAETGPSDGTAQETSTFEDGGSITIIMNMDRLREG
jgi:hypothetical protein